MTKRSITYGSAVIPYTLQWSERRALRISVDASGVSVTAPTGVDPSAVDTRVKRRARWILRQQRRVAAFKPITPPRQYVGGETHRYLGRQYRLRIVPTKGEERVCLRSGRIVVETRRPADPAWTQILIDRWFRLRAQTVLRERFQAALPFISRLGIAPPPLLLCAMRKRWGSHTPTGRIVLNIRLIAARRECIDYVIMHELCHVMEPNHSPRFFRLLRRAMPDWERRKELLERSTA